MTEARMVDAENGGRMPEGDGWFVLNARDARWLDGDLGRYTAWEGDGDAHFPQLGINISVLNPGEPMTMYHRENRQEDFLVLAGECVLLVQGEERPLKQWDLFHCPAGVDHAIVGAGDGSSLVLAVGARTGAEDNWVVYPADPVAQEHGAGVPVETSDPTVAYERFTLRKSGYEAGWLDFD
jgi:uncharacterized cupin superfamily protein